MDLSYANQTAVDAKELEEEIYSNPTFKVVNSMISDVLLFMFKFVLFDLLMTYTFSFNIFDYLIFNNLSESPFIPKSYPFRALYIPLILFVGLLAIGILFIVYKTISTMKPPMPFVK